MEEDGDAGWRGRDRPGAGIFIAVESASLRWLVLFSAILDIIWGTSSLVRTEGN